MHTQTHTQLVSLRHHLLLACSESETLTHLYKQQLASLDLEECHAHLRCVPFDLSTRLPGNKDLDYFMAQAREGRSSDSRLDRWSAIGLLTHCIKIHPQKYIFYSSDTYSPCTDKYQWCTPSLPPPSSLPFPPSLSPPSLPPSPSHLSCEANG